MVKLLTSSAVARTLGITSSAFLAGTLFSASFLAIPAILKGPPAVVLLQWRELYQRGKDFAIPSTIGSFLCHSLVAYQLYRAGYCPVHKVWSLTAFGALSTIAVIPYTLIVMSETNSRLLEEGEEGKTIGQADTIVISAVSEDEVKSLVDHWAFLNIARGILPAIGAIAAGWAAIS
ncbi:MAG: hypothetical protein M1825_002862 [Sarcosagium campestre]|nr:MAG: hypothetical protein M1825_002862 [Sarcosagium campestre]